MWPRDRQNGTLGCGGVLIGGIWSYYNAWTTILEETLAARNKTTALGGALVYCRQLQRKKITRDNFEGLKIRSGRKFGQVILDEVDSMLVDNGGNIAKLAEPFPGIKYLRYVYIKIWQELHKAEKSLVDEVTSEIHKFMNEYPDKEEGKRLAEEFLRVTIETEEAVIKDRVRKSQILESISIIPKHLQEFVRSKLNVWINNAAYAKYHCSENKQYRIMENDEKERIIVPVDYQNTGISLKNTIWSNGLHQFVQLKHNFYLTFESMTSSFISNLGYIKMYEENNLYLFGMTGTLGSEAEQQLISDVYSVDYARIPPFKKKDFKELDGLIFENDRWHVELIITILKTIDKGRAVLVVCETVQDLNKLAGKLKCLHKEKMHVRIFANEEGAEETKVKVQPGDIILATNIAGRGTNFKTSKDLEENGGLHVCVGFLPNNKRVEDQAFGRTSRQGNSGTAQLIIRQSEVEKLEIKDENPNFDLIKEERDKLESERLENVKNTLVKELIFKDKLFRYFSEKHRELKKATTNKPVFYYSLKDFKEAWAFWLEKKNFKVDNIKNTKARKEFDDFLIHHISILAGVDFYNPFYKISLAEHYLENDDLTHSKQAAIKIARTHLEGAIKMSDDNSPSLAGAYLKLFELSIDGGSQLEDRLIRALELLSFFLIETKSAYKIEAKEHLQSALKCLRIELDYFERNLANGETNQLNPDFQQILIEEKSEFLKHVFSRHQLLKMHEDVIKDLMQKVDDWDGVAIRAKERISHPNVLRETMELQGIGLDLFYDLKQVRDVPRTVIYFTQGQIILGTISIAAAFVFPPFALLSIRVGTALIADAVVDLILQILSQGEEEFNKKDYILGKLIFISLDILTGGISTVGRVILVKMAIKIANAFRWVVKFLRGSKYLRKITNILANILEKFNKRIIARLDEIARIERKVPKNRVEVVHELVKEGSVQFKKRFVKSIIKEKVIEPLLTTTIDNILDEIQKRIWSAFVESMRSLESLKEKLRTSSLVDINASIDKFMESDFIRDTCEGVAKKLGGYLRNSVLDIVFRTPDWIDDTLGIAKFRDKFIYHLQDTLPGGSSNNDVDKVIKDVAMEGAKTLVSMFKDFIKGLEGLYPFDLKKLAKSTKKLTNPREFFKLAANATKEEVWETFRRIVLEGNIDKKYYDKLSDSIQDLYR